MYIIIWYGPVIYTPSVAILTEEKAARDFVKRKVASGLRKRYIEIYRGERLALKDFIKGE